MENTLSAEVSRELALVRVEASGQDQDRALDVVGRWSAKLLKLDANRFTVELAGEPSRINDFLTAIQPFGLVTLRRSGELKLR